VPANDRGPSVGRSGQCTGTTPLTAHARALSVIDRSPPSPSSRRCNRCSRPRRYPSERERHGHRPGPGPPGMGPRSPRTRRTSAGQRAVPPGRRAAPAGKRAAEMSAEFPVAWHTTSSLSQAVTARIAETGDEPDRPVSR